jgi:hypothetical protein
MKSKDRKLLTYLNFTTDEFHKLVGDFFQEHFDKKGNCVQPNKQGLDKLYNLHHRLVDVIEQYEDNFNINK